MGVVWKFAARMGAGVGGTTLSLSSSPSYSTPQSSFKSGNGDTTGLEELFGRGLGKRATVAAVGEETATAFISLIVDDVAARECVTNLSSGERIGLGFVFVASMFSLAAILIFLGFYIRDLMRSYRSRGSNPNESWSAISTNIDIYFLFLLLFDALLSLSGLLNLSFIHTGTASCSPLCTAQGILGSLGAIGVALSLTAIAFHTIFVIFSNGRTPKRAIGWGVGATVWGIVLMMVLVPYGVRTSSAGAETGFHYYEPTPTWCWISSRYHGDRVGVAFLPLWITLTLTFLIYTLLFLFLRGNIIIVPEHWTRIRWRRLPSISSGSSSESGNSAYSGARPTAYRSASVYATTGGGGDGGGFGTMSRLGSGRGARISGVSGTASVFDSRRRRIEARKMLWYPGSYLLLVFPISIVRFNVSPERSATALAVAGSIFHLSGLLNVLLFWFTRPNILLFGVGGGSSVASTPRPNGEVGSRAGIDRERSPVLGAEFSEEDIRTRKVKGKGRETGASLDLELGGVLPADRLTGQDISAAPSSYRPPQSASSGNRTKHKRTLTNKSQTRGLMHSSSVSTNNDDDLDHYEYEAIDIDGGDVTSPNSSPSHSQLTGPGSVSSATKHSRSGSSFSWKRNKSRFSFKRISIDFPSPRLSSIYEAWERIYRGTDSASISGSRPSTGTGIGAIRRSTSLGARRGLSRAGSRSSRSTRGGRYSRLTMSGHAKSPSSRIASPPLSSTSRRSSSGFGTVSLSVDFDVESSSLSGHSQGRSISADLRRELDGIGTGTDTGTGTFGPTEFESARDVSELGEREERGENASVSKVSTTAVKGSPEEVEKRRKRRRRVSPLFYVPTWARAPGAGGTGGNSGIGIGQAGPGPSSLANAQAQLRMSPGRGTLPLQAQTRSSTGTSSLRSAEVERLRYILPIGKTHHPKKSQSTTVASTTLRGTGANVTGATGISTLVDDPCIIPGSPPPPFSPAKFRKSSSPPPPVPPLPPKYYSLKDEVTTHTAPIVEPFQPSQLLHIEPRQDTTQFVPRPLPVPSSIPLPLPQPRPSANPNTSLPTPTRTTIYSPDVSVPPPPPFSTSSPTRQRTQRPALVIPEFPLPPPYEPSPFSAQKAHSSMNASLMSPYRRRPLPTPPTSTAHEFGRTHGFGFAGSPSGTMARSPISRTPTQIPTGHQSPSQPSRISPKSSVDPTNPLILPTFSASSPPVLQRSLSSVNLRARHHSVTQPSAYTLLRSKTVLPAIRTADVANSRGERATIDSVPKSATAALGGGPSLGTELETNERRTVEVGPERRNRPGRAFNEVERKADMLSFIDMS